MIHESAEIRSGASIDPTASVDAFAYVGAGCVLGPECRVGVRATLSDSPDSPTRLERGAVVGAGCVVDPGVTIGAGAQVRAGAVLDTDAPPGAIIQGNPAAVVGYAGDDPVAGARFVAPPEHAGDSTDFVGCSLVRLPRVLDLRGALTFGEADQYLPFRPERFFLVYDVPSSKVRGSHAHHELHEWIMAVNGSVTVTVDNGAERAQVLLDDPTLALHLRPMTWTTQYAYSPGSVLLVLCSHKYEDADYIRSYDEYLRLVT